MDVKNLLVRGAVAIFIAMLISCVNVRKKGGHEEVPEMMLNDTLSRSAYLKLPPKAAASVMRDVAPAVKTALWRHKLKDVIENWGLNEEEKAVVESIYQTITPAYFEVEAPEEVNQEMMAKVARLSWSEERVYFTLCTLETLEELQKWFSSEANPKVWAEISGDPYLSALFSTNGARALAHDASE